MASKKKVVPNNNEKRLVKRSDIRKEKIRMTIGKIMTFILALIIPIILVFLASTIQRETAELALTWMKSNFGVVIINFAIIYALFYFFQLLIKKSWVSFLLSSILYLLPSVISKLKYDVRGEVLLINDLSLVSNAGEMSSFIELTKVTGNNIVISLVAILIIMIILFIKFKKPKEVSRRSSLVNLLLCIAFITVAFMNNNVLKFFGINNNIRYTANVVHENQGTLIGLYSNYKMNQIEEPENYSKEEIYKILDEVNLASKNENSNSIKPDIIMIMSESFCDPTLFPNIKLSKDPLEYIRYITNNENAKYGTLVTSTFAGGTSNIEYEAFTGTSGHFMPYGTVPYTDLKENISDIDTIQKILKANGYETTALHSYIGTFYDRNIVYPTLGFDTFKEANDLTEVGYYGKYVGDVVVYKNIIETLKNNKDNKPQFVWALTMQNHTPYSGKNLGEEALYIDVSGDSLTDVAKDKLLGYVNGVYESSRRLKLLIDYVNESKRPTIIMFFGDHMPALYEVYYDTNMISTKDTTKWTVREMLTMHSVPFFVYANYNNDKIKNLPTTTGAIFLGNTLLNLANINKTSYFKFLDTVDYTALRDRLFVDKFGIAYEEILSEYDDIINRQKLLQYDIIYGNNYTKKYDEENL